MTSMIITIIALVVFVHRCIARKLRAVEVFVFSAFLMHYIVIQGTILSVYGMWGDLDGPCWRYHYPSVPIVLGLAALPVVALARRLPCRKLALCGLVIALFALQVVQGVRTVMCKNGYGRDWRTVNWAVAAIKSDWPGRRPDKFKPTRSTYFRIGRPSVMTSMPAIPYYAGGRGAIVNMSRKSFDDFDYVLDPIWAWPYQPKGGEAAWERVMPGHFEELSRFNDGKYDHVLYRRKR